MSTIRNLAELIAQGVKPGPKEALLDRAKRLPKANAVEPTEQGKKELGKLAMDSKMATVLENPYASRRRSKRVSSDRDLPPRPISYKDWSALILVASGVDLSDDTLQKLCDGGDLDTSTLFKIDAAGFIKHPAEARAITSEEMFAILRSETTIEDMKAESEASMEFTFRRAQGLRS